MAERLDENIINQIYPKMREGFELAKQNRYPEAKSRMLEAWDLIPEPKYGWDISKITIYRISKFFRDAKAFEEAHNWIDKISNCSVLPGDGEPQLIKGSIFFEAGDMNAAYQWLSKAYDISGRRIFAESDEKYLTFLRGRNKIGGRED